MTILASEENLMMFMVLLRHRTFTQDPVNALYFCNCRGYTPALSCNKVLTVLGNVVFSHNTTQSEAAFR